MRSTRRAGSFREGGGTVSRTLRRSTTVEGRKLETAQRRAATEPPPPSGHLAAAREETAARPLLAVASLEEKLERALPAAFIEDAGPQSKALSRWRVCRDGLLIASGPTPREAIDRAILLRGAR